MPNTQREVPSVITSADALKRFIVAGIAALKMELENVVVSVIIASAMVIANLRRRGLTCSIMVSIMRS